MKLGRVYDPRNNALNLCRLLLATEVILFHSFPLSGNEISPKPLLQLAFSVGVDGFFALSGFLITSSWLRDPHVRDYLIARALRILPGYYVVLAVTAFVIAPLSVLIQGGSPMSVLLSSAPVQYVLKNAGLLQVQIDIAGTPRDIPYPGIWNASLWSLIFEVACYLALAGLGVVGLAARRWTSIVIVALMTLAALMLPPLTFPGVWTIPQLAVRAAIMFAAGAVMYQWRDVIPARWSLVALSLLLVVGSGFLPDYRVVGALPLAYAVVVSGALLKHERLRLRTDISYGTYIYASPAQQLLATAGLYTLNPFVFFLVSVAAIVPLATLSWVLVEKRALALKPRLKRWNSPPANPEPFDRESELADAKKPESEKS